MPLARDSKKDLVQKGYAMNNKSATCYIFTLAWAVRFCAPWHDHQTPPSKDLAFEEQLEQGQQLLKAGKD